MTLNLEGMGFDPNMIQAARRVGSLLRLEITKRPGQGVLKPRYVALNPEDPEATKAMASCVDSFATQVAMLHDTMLGMKGKIIQE